MQKENWEIDNQEKKCTWGPSLFSQQPLIMLHIIKKTIVNPEFNPEMWHIYVISRIIFRIHSARNSRIKFLYMVSIIGSSTLQFLGPNFYKYLKGNFILQFIMFFFFKESSLDLHYLNQRRSFLTMHLPGSIKTNISEFWTKSLGICIHNKISSNIWGTLSW